MLIHIAANVPVKASKDMRSLSLLAGLVLCFNMDVSSSGKNVEKCVLISAEIL